ncbi:acyltransferase [Ferrimonas marina]|uniref:Surface polysaccharide O-acyltransferase, integral membrane enzyme n=1 Tax=Ferrimonas marina TaxID=299255 RepID=A0A1M5MHX2_9GAMM|nr:acyltransferase family protein [Ferrimonas marina]SHG76938.1 Surface polysaccharide O-acyltransferase, integral membrane enzyme [Ferrimonas marina]
MSAPRQDIFYLHLLRTLAAIAVIAIHVLGPYRDFYGLLPMHDWFGAIGINALTRWAVPVFMMISGALLLSSNKPFDCSHYLQRRLGKVVVPFIAWTVLYAVVIGWQAGDWGSTLGALVESPNQPVWYHLWFFYDFIPLYFVIPLLAPLLKAMTEEQVKILLAAWFTLTLMNLLRVETPLRENLILYTGYLILGWYLINRDNRPQLKLWLWLGLGSAVVNLVGTWYFSQWKGDYSSMFMGYKTLNTVLIGGMIFVLAQAYGDRLGDKARAVITSISKYSLGIYLLHPLLLIPVRNLSNGVYGWFGHSLLAIPAITLVTLLVAWAITAALARIPVIRQLVP